MRVVKILMLLSIVFYTQSEIIGLAVLSRHGHRYSYSEKVPSYKRT